ncbi:16303_t:CDS:2 [Racocetra fulgida]|uniref:16303_t:CDS:1 n=1 Tax=Racocetra fulgida TaxID=60492 RepID=A0A9N9CEX9_9GLOM|nr:16303_t:CDS:2 [Racocetra fulgida]
MDAFTRLLGDLNSEACRAIIQVIDIMLQTCPFQTLSETMINTGLLWKLLNSILSGSEYVAIANQQYNLPQINLIEKVLEVWLDKSTLSEEDESSQNLHDSFTNEKEEDEKPTLQVTYQGFNIFYKSLIVIVEPPGQIIEFGDNVKVASAMTIDDYLGQDDSDTDVGSNGSNHD